MEKVWKLQSKVVQTVAKDYDNTSIDVLVHKIVKKVTKDLETLQFNTAIAKMMELVNAFQKEEVMSKEHFEILVLMLAPFAPHMAEEIWHGKLEHDKTIAFEKWPIFDPNKIIEEEITLAVQVNGKVRANIVVAVDVSEEDIKTQALAHENIVKCLEGKTPKKVMYIAQKLVSVVV